MFKIFTMIKDYLKLTLNYLFNLITGNNIKFIVLIITIISYNLAGTFEDYPYKQLIVNQFKEEDKFIYIKKSSGSYDTIVKDEQVEIDEDGYYNTMEYNEVNILFWSIFTLGFFWSLIGLFAYEEDGWEFSYNWKKSIRSLVTTELDNDTYYYIALGRLIGKSNRSLKSYVLDEFNINELRDILLCPKFQTKRTKRNNILSKIGIK